MTTITATIKARRLELDAPADWPDGTEVEIHAIEQHNKGGTNVMSPEEIAKTLAAMDLVEPFEMTEAEQASWEAQRRACKEREKAHFADHFGELRSAWK